MSLFNYFSICETYCTLSSPEAWQRNIAARNAAVLAGETRDYYVDEGLLEKIQAAFEPPAREEMDFWYQG